MIFHVELSNNMNGAAANNAKISFCVYVRREVLFGVFVLSGNVRPAVEPAGDQHQLHLHQQQRRASSSPFHFTHTDLTTSWCTVCVTIDIFFTLHTYAFI